MGRRRYRCVVSIAGVTDPKQLGLNALNFVGGRAAREFIGDDDVDLLTRLGEFLARNLQR